MIFSPRPGGAWWRGTCAESSPPENIHLTIANGENSAGGFGITPQLADELFGYGVDVLTSGNHIWDKREIYDYLRPPAAAASARPIMSTNCPDRAWSWSRRATASTAPIMNLQGRVYMPPDRLPVSQGRRAAGRADPDVKVRFVDFHAELTSEKMAMGWYLDGRVSAVIGTHTHIPTADTRILPGGTAYQTDAGMTGPYHSVIGVEKPSSWRNF